MGLFSNLSSATPQGRGKKIKESGEFVVRIDRTKLQASNQGFGTLWIVEFTIVEGTDENPPGADRSWVQMPEHGTRAKTDPGNIKAYVGALLGDDSEDPEVPEAEFERATSEANPYKGTLLKLSTEQIETKAGYPFVVHEWSCLPASYEAPAPQHAPPPEIPPPAPAPAAPQELTKKAWLAGQGPGTVHPRNPQYEYSPKNPSWGVRSKA